MSTAETATAIGEGDRVQVVSGHYYVGRSGKVVDVSFGMRLVDFGDGGAPFWCHESHLRAIPSATRFQVGQRVRVTRGDFRHGRSGKVVNPYLAEIPLGPGQVLVYLENEIPPYPFDEDDLEVELPPRIADETEARTFDVLAETRAAASPINTTEILAGVDRWIGRDPANREVMVGIKGGVVTVTAGTGSDCRTCRFVGPVAPAGVEAAIDITLVQASREPLVFGGPG